MKANTGYIMALTLAGLLITAIDLQAQLVSRANYWRFPKQIIHWL